MAEFSYEKYTAQNSARAQAINGDRPKTRFVGEFLKESGSTVIVRFPYHSMADIKFETTHSVRFPGDKYDKRVRCEGDNCPLCANKVKVDTRFFVKVVIYEIENGQVKLIPAIWDRPAAFADITIKNLIAEYGDLTKLLFKMKRNGTGLDTTYDILPVLNTTVYNPEVYVADFSCLEGLDPTRVLTRTVKQYLDAIDGVTNDANIAQGQVQEQTFVQQPAPKPQVQQEPQVQPQPTYQPQAQPQQANYQQPEPNFTRQPLPTNNTNPTGQPQESKPHRYSF